MRLPRHSVVLTCLGLVAAQLCAFASLGDPQETRTFDVKGSIEEVQPERRTITIRHEAIPNYMDAMTMPFKVRDAEQLSGLQKGDVVTFRLHVSESESWIDDVTKRRTSAGRGIGEGAKSGPTAALTPRPRHPLMDYKFTNELGQAVSLSDFRGQALAITFFFTRCPIPDYCPRLSKNFQEASRKLSSLADGPTNWHFLSVSFDTEIDNPRVLKAYAEMYHYDPAHWSFLTGPADKIGELARLSDVKFERDGGSFNHNFRTLIIDPNGHLQTVFPTGGNLSDAIVDEILKAAALTQGAASRNPARGEQDETRNTNRNAGSATFHGG